MGYLQFGAPDFFVSVAADALSGDGGLDDGSEFGLEKSDSDLLFAIGRSVS